MEDEPKAKNIADRIQLLFLVLAEGFRRHKPGSSAACVQIAARVDVRRESKVNDNHVAIRLLRPKHDVFWLDVTVEDLLGMEMLQAVQERLHDDLDLAGAKRELTLNGSRLT